MNHTSFARRVLLAACCLTITAAGPASAQYFGQNKVHYKNLNFQVLKTEHFDIYYYPSERNAIDIAARMAERWYARLSRVFDHQLRGRQPLIVYSSSVDFQQTNVIPGEIGAGTGGVTEPLRRRIVIPLGGSLTDTNHVIGHELVHAFQFDMTSGPNAPAGQNGAERLPLWFIEGMAEYLSLGPVDANTAMWLRDAERQEKLPSIDDLDKPTYFPYRWGQAFWAYVGGRWGDDVIRKMLAVAAAAGDVHVAIQKVIGVKTKDLSNAWQTSIRTAYDPLLASTTPAGEVGHLVIRSREGAGDLNVGPAISPDGRWLALLSSRSLLSTDLYIANAKTGEIVRKLTSTATDPHFSSIEFIYSAGGWDSASKRLAIAAVTNGHPALVIFDADSGDKEREIPIPTLDQIVNPTWAPDDHAICFSGMTHGVTDLFLYDLKASKMQRLTNDAYADLQPSWSPDGGHIAFVSDRFSTNLDTLDTGRYELAEIDASIGRIRPIQTFAHGDSIDPQWSSDGRSLYFISNRTGIPNLYGMTLATGALAQLSNLGTGVSGITASSPALSVAAGSDVAAFSVFERGGYDIYTLDPTRPLGHLTQASRVAATLPPLDREPSEIGALINSPTLGLPPRQTYPTKEYEPSLSLEGVGQPVVALGVDRFGPAVGGGISLYFGDMLGNHTLATSVQANSGFGGSFSVKDIAGQVAYFNQAHRWQWGVAGGQVPYLSGGFDSGIGATTSGEPVQVDRTTVFRQTERSGTVVTAYPFDRAQRIELQGGATRISFDRTTETAITSLVTGQLLADTTATSSVASSVTLGTASAALVWDTASFGATSPVQGQRYRLEAAPAFGSINFTNVLADYRRYFMPAPFYTLAARVLHDGRYGSGAEDPRLFPMYLGYPTLVRGYDINTFSASDCMPTATSQCPAIDRLLGSRMLVGNFEFRFPLLRPFNAASEHMYGPLPVEVALFADGGVAWNSGERPALIGGTRHGVWSAGAALRVNLFGYAVGEFDFARPFQRPNQGWVFQFNLTPGF